ncbi:MAG: sigma-70 family RNA polymerase sigma factor [Phycisphaerae bacterium]
MSDYSTRQSLLIRIRQPDAHDAWQEFDAIYRPLLARVARARGLSDADVDDVVQHCMIAVARHIRSFEYDPARGRFKAWLCTLVGNRIRNLLRDRRDAASADENSALEQRREALPDDEFERLWMEEHLRHALARVAADVSPDSYRAFVRHVLEGADVETTCRELNLSANQLYKIKWRVTQKLRECLADLEVDLPA